MSGTTLALVIETPALEAAVSWNGFETLAVQMGKDLPRQALAEALGEAQERLIDVVCGPRWTRCAAWPHRSPARGVRRAVTSPRRAGGPGRVPCTPRRARCGSSCGTWGAAVAGGASLRCW